MKINTVQFPDLLGLLLIYLKLTGEINWSWAWVLFPLIVYYSCLIFLYFFGTLGAER